LSILAIDAAGAQASIAVTDDNGHIVARFSTPGRPGLIETLPALLADAVKGQSFGFAAITIGPGSFTGLRTSLALAQGFCAGAKIPLYGVTVDEAFAQAFPTLSRPLWTAIRARKNRIFLIHNGVATAFADNDLPRPKHPIAAAGNAAPELAAHIAAYGGNVLLTNARHIDPAWVARAAIARLHAGLPPHAPQPLYVDPPEAKRLG
jgi:tRNA threonylcarbamoyl adenosine modification protein YeaZ